MWDHGGVVRGGVHLPALSKHIDSVKETFPKTLQAACTNHCVSWHGRLGSAAVLEAEILCSTCGTTEGYLGGKATYRHSLNAETPDSRPSLTLAGCIEYVFKTCLMPRCSLEKICSNRYTLHKIPVYLPFSHA